MVLFGTQFRDLTASFGESKVQKTPEITPVGRTIGRIIQVCIASGVVWVFIKGVHVLLGWIGLDQLAGPGVSRGVWGLLWVLITSFLVERLHHTLIRGISLEDHLAPYFGHHLYRTYRALRGT